MKLQIKAAIIAGSIAGGTAIIVALITAFGISSNNRPSQPPATAIQNINGDSNKVSGRDYYDNSQSVKEAVVKP